MKININIKGMHCSSCEAIIEDSLLENIGINKVDISHKSGSASIEYDENKTDIDEITKIIEKEGYEVVDK